MKAITNSLLRDIPISTGLEIKKVENQPPALSLYSIAVLLADAQKSNPLLLYHPQKWNT